MACLFIYSGGHTGFSGQVAATEMIVDGLREDGKVCHALFTPALDRTAQANKSLLYLSYGLRLLKCWAAALAWRFRSLSAIHLTVGQTTFALVRDGVALYLAAWGRPKSFRCVAPLHGSIFASWDYHSRDARLFRWVLGRCDYVTCLGDSHREALVKLGIPKKKVRLVPNVCEFDGVTSAFVENKHAGEGPLRVLHLSSLIDTKGYPEFLDALELLAQREGAPIQATLCGPVTMSAYGERFKTVSEARAWIAEKVESIGRSTRVKVTWLEGARGEEKQRLFEEAHLFVLPTRYPVEAQPLVIIEALASGCAVITSRIGEIPSTVDDSCAITQAEPSAETVADAIDALMTDTPRRKQLAQAGLQRFQQRFTRDAHMQRWYQLLGLAGEDAPNESPNQADRFRES